MIEKAVNFLLLVALSFLLLTAVAFSMLLFAATLSGRIA